MRLFYKNSILMKMKSYDHSKIEGKWQKIWEKKKPNKALDNSKKPKFYSLIEFPYPSGDGLHVGHPRPYIGMDVISRKRRAEGFNVLYPIGWDAFGLPTENYAIKTGIQPKVVTKKNTDTFRKQIKSLGISFDWDREINTTDPKYYRWTQWIFLQFFKHGLAYKKKMTVNWCPKDKIVLANEEVIDGKCERCGTPVEKREKEQWMLAITKYADRLDKDLDTVDYMPQIKLQQRNWIGRSEGAEIDFLLDFKKTPEANKNRGPHGEKAAIKVFTTRPDTLFGATYLVLSPEHLWVKLATDEKHNVLENKSEVLQYITAAKKKTEMERTAADKEKTGVELKGVKAINPANGEEIPMFVADYVLADYGTGAIMAVPAHDERDFEFAKKFKLPIKEVVIEQINNRLANDEIRKVAISVVENKKGEILILSYTLDNVTTYELPGGGVDEGESEEDASQREVREETGYTNLIDVRRIGTVEANYFSNKRKINRRALAIGFAMKLADETKIELNLTELEKKGSIQALWVSKQKALELLANKQSSSSEDLPLFKRYLEQNYGAYQERGVLINSGKFDGLKSEEAKKSITESVGGKMVTTFKLRDWVFSRQRYWGEPIPIIHCENCEKKKYHFVILHGRGGSIDANFFPELKKRLLTQGHSVFAENLPIGQNGINIDEQVDFLLKKARFDENTIIVAHSLGGVAVHKLLPKLEKKIHKVVFVDSFIHPTFTDNPRPDVEMSNDWKFDFKKAKAKVEEVIALGDSAESVVPNSETEALAKAYGVKPIFAHPTERHFCGQDELTVFGLSIPSGFVPVPEKDLPLKLPEVKNYQPTDTGESPLAAIEKWVNVKCPVCKSPAKRETDTMPNWAGSSWYYLRYIDPKNSKQFASPNKLAYWSNLAPSTYNLEPALVDWYNGGMEHTTLHLLYSRFWHKFLYDLKLVPTSEPYKKRTSHGLILGEGGVKMSKSKGNVVNPNEIVKLYGADTLRIYEMFMGPFAEHVVWSTESIIGSRRFLEKIWKLQEKISNAKNILPVINKTIKKVSEDIEAMRFNTAISALMIAVNELEKETSIPRDSYEALLKLLAPFAPHIAEELWAAIPNKKPIASEPWPQYDASIVAEEKHTIVVQVNGKVRGEFEIGNGSTEDEIKKQAVALPAIQKWFEGKEAKKIIYVKNKLVSIVL